MEHANQGISKKAVWAGRIISALLSLLLLFSGVMKLSGAGGVAEEFKRFGYDPNVARGIGIVEIVCVILYVIPRTSVLGAILLTGYLGGAMATHLRIGEPVVVQFILGMLVWLGIFLRDRRVRSLVPLRSQA